MNHLGAGQGKVDQTEIEKIVWCLVDQMRLRQAIAGDAFTINVAETGKIYLSRTLDHLELAARAGSELHQGKGKVVNFSQAADLAV